MFKRIFAAAAIISAPAFADPPSISAVNAQQSGGLWRFDVTITHGDTGWDHYADGWRVLDPQGNELGVRNLAHPHVDEQPFTRSLSGVRVPDGVTEVDIQARDNVSGWAPTKRRVQLR
ncbi:hypothetical protein AB2B41_01030 [Marimonas sp. MJW-29]|uniref:Uncharacterized protein n=1 Tax=Sulfitobacter sediminis TaxID=3234186 RepID=A0ABV3RGT1_9RHOB